MIDLGLAKPPRDARVVVAMSGGVDSSVVAGLLARAGYGVIGVTLQLYDHGKAAGRPGTCCAGQDIHDARRVAAALRIPHYVLDYEARFRRAVIDDFVDAYAAGLTPIPCVRCNQRIKFGDLLGLAHELGADALATGHYVRRVAGPDGAELHAAAEGARDQSYFLFATTPAQLARLRFPLGDLAKDAVRGMARELGLAVADKPDSQDICFVPDGRYAEVVARARPDAVRPGAIVDEAGRELGRHDGVIHFTVGQRKGLGIAAPEPLYVLRIDAAASRVVVGPRAALGGLRLALAEANWLADPAGREVTVKLRSTQAPAWARVEPLPGGRAIVELARPDAAIAPGQACVVYDGPRVLGGGWIERRPALTETGSAAYIGPSRGAAE